MFTGCCVAIVTPMDGDSVDYQTLSDLVKWQIDAGTQAIVAAGTTGESCALSQDETLKVLEVVLEAAQSKVPVIAGTGTNNTEKTIEQTRKATALGCDAALIITPYYNKPTQAGMLAHYQAVHEATDTPILLYNNPARTAVDLLPQTVATLSQLPRIVGIKEAVNDLSRLEALVSACAPDFVYYSGDDATASGFMRQGGHGVISIAANLLPQKMQALSAACLNHDPGSQALEQVLSPVFDMLTVESNPIPVKWALTHLGKIKSGIRLPLTTLSQSHQQSFSDVLEKAVGAVHA